MKNMKRTLTGERGFTLIELLVVMAILAVLAAMVFPTVTGMKTGSEGASGKADAKEVENAVAAYNTADTQANPWPDNPIVCASGTYSAAYNIVITDTARGGTDAKTVLVGPNSVPVALTPAITNTASVNLPANCTAGQLLSTHTQIKWTAEAQARQKDGSVIPMRLIPDYLASQPKSSLMVRGPAVATAASEFIWLFRKGSELDGQSGRSLQVLRLTTDGLYYSAAKN